MIGNSQYFCKLEKCIKMFVFGLLSYFVKSLTRISDLIEQESMRRLFKLHTVLSPHE